MKKIFFICLWIIAGCVNANSIQGKVYFYQYCSGCHDLKYGELDTFHQANLNSYDAEQWFGKSPPDLSLITLQYSKKWLIQYLLAFYPDDNGRFGVNNHISPNILMPNVLAHSKDDKINLHKIVYDITNYLDEVAEPERKNRYFWGVWVLFFCAICVILSAILSKFYKK